MSGIQIETRLRPCYINIGKGNKEKALFHCWSHFSGGRPGGIVAYSTGIVELEDGKVIEVMPTNITFCEDIFNDYYWDEKGEKMSKADEQDV